MKGILTFQDISFENAFSFDTHTKRYSRNLHHNINSNSKLDSIEFKFLTAKFEMDALNSKILKLKLRIKLVLY